jgi:hypothetical protein
MTDAGAGDGDGGGVECAECVEAGVAFAKGEGEVALSFGNGKVIE